MKGPRVEQEAVPGAQASALHRRDVAGHETHLDPRGLDSLPGTGQRFVDDVNPRNVPASLRELDPHTALPVPISSADPQGDPSLPSSRAMSSRSLSAYGPTVPEGRSSRIDDLEGKCGGVIKRQPHSLGVRCRESVASQDCGARDDHLLRGPRDRVGSRPTSSLTPSKRPSNRAAVVASPSLNGGEGDKLERICDPADNTEVSKEPKASAQMRERLSLTPLVQQHLTDR